MATPTRRAAVYLRASLDLTGEREAVQRHEKECLKIVNGRGWRVVETYTDNSISSRKGVDRPAYRRMMVDYAAGKFDAIVCWDLDRLTRVPRDLEDMIDACEDGNLALVTANGEADLTTDGGQLFARVKVAVARDEVQRKGERQRLAQQQRAENGRPAKGVRPTGYTLAGEIIEDEAAVVRRIYDRFTAGDTLKGIAADLARDGYTTRRGGQWSSSSVSSILRSKRYAGRSTYKGEDVGPGTWPAIISEEQYNAVQARLSDPRRKTRGETTARKHLGSGLYYCTCGLRVRSSSGMRNGLNRYTCRHTCYYRSAAPVDDYVLRLVRARLAMPDLRELLVRPVDEDRLRALAAERSDLRHRLQVTEADYDEDLIDGRRFRAKTEKIYHQLDAIRSEEATLLAHAGPDAVLAADDPVAAFDAAPLAIRRQTIDALLSVTLRRGVHGSRTFNPDSVEVAWR